MTLITTFLKPVKKIIVMTQNTILMLNQLAIKSIYTSQGILGVYPWCIPRMSRDAYGMIFGHSSEEM